MAVTERAHSLGGSALEGFLPACSGTEIYEYQRCLCLYSHYEGISQSVPNNANCNFLLREISVPSGIPGERKICGLIFCSMAIPIILMSTKADWHCLHFHPFCCLLTNMYWVCMNGQDWRAGFFQLFHLLMAGRAAVASDCTLGSNTLWSATAPKALYLPSNNCDYAKNSTFFDHLQDEFWPCII